MKDLKDYKEIIHKCSKCGLCQSVCPAYLETGNECTVSRGQFVMLQGVIKGDLKLSRTINKYLDMCLKCGKCSDFCPSDIDIVEVILAAKSEYFRKSLEGKFLSIIQSKLVFNTALWFLKLFRSKKKFNKQFDKKAIYFGGCIENLYPKTAEYTKELLNNMGIEIIDIDFNCCGLPFLTSGNLERFVEQAEENISKIKDLEFDYIVTDCASCVWAWKEYSKYCDINLDDKLKNIYNLIEENNFVFESKDFAKITYHEPCHGSCENTIKRIKNVEYIELEDKNSCCGLPALLKPSTWDFYKKLSNKKRKSIIKSGADIVLTNCIGCLTSLKFMLKSKKKVMRVIDFLTKCKLEKN